MHFSQWTIGRKITGGFALMLTLTLALTAVFRKVPVFAAAEAGD